MKNTRVIYAVVSDHPDMSKDQYNEFLPKEFHLIKTMLNDGFNIKSIKKLEVSKEYVEQNFM